MAATKTRAYLTAVAERKLLDFDPNSTAASLVDLVPGAAATCVAIEEAESFLFGIFHSVGTTDIAVNIVACTSNTGAGATTVISSTADIDAVGDYLWLEVDVSQIREVLSTATHVGVQITLTTNTDECVVYYEKHGRFQYPSLTANYVS